MVVYAQNLRNATKLPSYDLLCETFQMKRINGKQRMHSEHDKIWEHSSTESSGCVKIRNENESSQLLLSILKLIIKINSEIINTKHMINYLAHGFS